MKFAATFFLAASMFLSLIHTTANAEGEGYRPLQGAPDCCGTGCVQPCISENGISNGISGINLDTDDDAAGGNAGSAESKKVEVKAVGVKFAPLVAYAEVGDTVIWTNMAAHFVESIAEMSPADLEAFQSEMSADFAFEVKSEGIITYKCPPHWGARMGGFIVVGKPDNLEELLEQYMETANTTAGLKAAKGLVKKLRKDLTKNGHL